MKHDAIFDKARLGLPITDQEMREITAHWTAHQIKAWNQLTRPTLQHFDAIDSWNTPRPQSSACSEVQPPAPPIYGPVYQPAVQPICPMTRPDKAPNPRPGTAPDPAASALARQHEVVQTAMLAWLRQGSLWHDSLVGKLTHRGLLRTQGMTTIWDTLSGHPIIVEYDENGYLERISVPEHEGERGTVISPEEGEHSDVCREHDPPDVLMNMGQGHPLRVEYKDCGAVGNMWIPMWRLSHELINERSCDGEVYLQDEGEGENGEDVFERLDELGQLDQPPYRLYPWSRPVLPGADMDRSVDELVDSFAQLGPKRPKTGQ